MSGLAEWCGEVLPRVRNISDEVSRVYAEEANLPHYRFLATYLERRYGDAALAQAAFLHGVATHHLRKVTGGLVREEVLAILEEREKLRALNREDLDVDEPLLANVLQSLRLAQSIVLFVLEQAHHLDPDGTIARWSLRFHRNPAPLDRGSVNGPRYKSGYDLENLANFSRNVVAPTARFFGLWRGRNVVEDATLLYSRPDRFEALQAFAIQESGTNGGCGNLVRFVEGILGDLVKAGSVESVHWEWRHAGSLHRNLPKSTGTDWRKLLYRTGFVTVICRESEDCYRAVHRLHARLRYRPTELRDILGEPTPAGYRAFHTTLTTPAAGEIASEAIPVRLVPREAVRVRRSRFHLGKLNGLQGRLKPEGGIDLRVFTPDGRGVVLPVGATVLDFALALNRSWIARLAGATVNRRPVDILHPLKPSDVVWLDLSDSLLPLPRGWEKRINKKRVPKVRKEFKTHYKPELETAGRLWLEKNLLARGVTIPPDPRQLSDLLDDAVHSMKHFKSRQASPQLLRQLGLIAALERGEELPFQRRIDVPLAERMVSAVEDAVRRLRLVTLHELEIPEHLKLGLQEVVCCTSCEPSLEGPLIGTLHDSRKLILHAVGRECGSEGFAVSRSRLTAHPQYLVLGVSNRVGIAAEILTVLQKHQVNVIDLAGCGLAAGWGVLRIQIDYTGNWKLQQIELDLKGIPGLQKIVMPGEPGVQALEVALPPRNLVQASSYALPPPYVCGSSIVEDAYLYGMEMEKGTLRRAFDEAIAGTARGGRAVFIHGPKRVGKTSLVNCFLRELDRSSPFPCLTLYHDALGELSWARMESRFTLDLARRLREGAERRGIELPPLAGLDFFELADLARRRFESCIVLAIDEACGLLAHCEEETEAVQSFRSRIEGQPGLLVLWVGPDASFLRLAEPLRNVLQRAESLRVESLAPAEIKKLLMAEKLSPKYRIEIPQAVASSVYQMTRGNPYWASFLGYEMWRIAQRQGRGSIRYDFQMLKRAKASIFGQGIPFVDRVETKGLAGRILWLFASLDGPEDLGELDLQSIHVRLAQEDPALTPGEVEEVLTELRARGSLVESDGEVSSQTWRISAPILADYIRWLQA